MNYKEIDKDDATGQFGQLYKDLVKSGQEDFCCTRWVFDQQMLDHYGGDINGLKNGIAKMVRETINKNSELKKG